MNRLISEIINIPFGCEICVPVRLWFLGQCRFRPDSGEREFRSVLGPTGNKLQRKLPEMKLKKKKKKHMKSKYEKKIS
ncbi:unnamed protein product [Brassica oleracea]